MAVRKIGSAQCRGSILSELIKLPAGASEATFTVSLD